MSEKRFVLEISSFSGKHMKFLNILDNGKRLNSEDIVGLLNEQQATIEAKNEYQRTLEAKIRRLKDRIKVLEK